MKSKKIAALIAAIIAGALLISGCTGSPSQPAVTQEAANAPADTPEQNTPEQNTPETTAENAEPTENAEPAAQPAAEDTPVEYIGGDVAKAAALKHAGVNESDISWIGVNMDRENGSIVYEIDFDAAGYEYDYEVDATTGEIVKSQKEVDDDYQAPAAQPAQDSTQTDEPAQAAPAAQTQTDYIGEAKAKSIALEHAGVKEEDAMWIEVKLDRENRTVVYDVDFDAAGYEYDYEINATTGDIVKSQKEVDDDYRAAQTQTQTQTQTQPQTDYISEAEAKSIALEHAGVNEDDALWIEVKLDREKNTVVYDIDFDAAGYEYDYEINATTGAVVKSQKEVDDDYRASQSQTQTQTQSDYIGEAEAKRIALDHAGVKEADARKLEVELDREHGRVIYDVSFDSGSYEYDYEVDALTGSILKSDKERD